jgi:hypothetical protein
VYIIEVFLFVCLLLVCRKVAIINLDPANDALPYPFSLIFLWFKVSVLLVLC